MAAVAGFSPDPAIETCWSPARGDPWANPFRLRFPRRFGGGALAEKPETYCAPGSALSVIGPGRSLRQAGIKRNRGLAVEQQARCSSLARKAALDPEPVAHDSHLECPPLEKTGTGWARPAGSALPHEREFLHRGAVAKRAGRLDHGMKAIGASCRQRGQRQLRPAGIRMSRDRQKVPSSSCPTNRAWQQGIGSGPGSSVIAEVGRRESWQNAHFGWPAGSDRGGRFGPSPSANCQAAARHAMPIPNAGAADTIR